MYRSLDQMSSSVAGWGRGEIMRRQRRRTDLNHIEDEEREAWEQQALETGRECNGALSTRAIGSERADTRYEIHCKLDLGEELPPSQWDYTPCYTPEVLFSTRRAVRDDGVRYRRYHRSGR